MDLQLQTERLDARLTKDVARAAEILRGGGTVAFPTETVYGLGANALSDTAVARIFAAKQRPSWDPLIVHVCDRRMLERVCVVPDGAEPLIARFWPGPLTLLLPRTAAVPHAITAKRALVGVRMPDHPVALEMIRLAGMPIAAPSANTFGHTSPTTAAHVLADLDGRIDAVLDGGATSIGLESTVLEMTSQGVRIYRAGAVDQAILEQSADLVEYYRPDHRSPSTPEALPSPGVGLRHYAPHARLELVNVAQLRCDGIPDSFVEAIGAMTATRGQVGVMLPDGWFTRQADYYFPWGPWGDPDTLAHRLFAGLRSLDDQGADTILCPIPHGDGIAAAIRDRLLKAAR